jgi:excinuclease UvrABC nuclease subunit
MPKLERPLPKLAKSEEKAKKFKAKEIVVEKSVKKEELKKGEKIKAGKKVEIKKDPENDKENLVDGAAKIKKEEDAAKPLDVKKTLYADQIGQYFYI